MKRKLLNVLCVIFAIATVSALIWGIAHKTQLFHDKYEDGIEQIDSDTIYLKGSGVEVDFADVIVSDQNETRKLIVSEQSGTVTTQLTDRLIKKLDWDFLKKTQNVSYTGKGYFVVDLDELSAKDVFEDSIRKTVTIKIEHAHLQAIDINPNDIMIDEVKEGLFARGDIELSVQDYNAIEKELRDRLEEKFNTAENGQKADEIALKMVKDVYEPIVKAINSRYTVIVEFK